MAAGSLFFPSHLSLRSSQPLPSAHDATTDLQPHSWAAATTSGTSWMYALLFGNPCNGSLGRYFPPAPFCYASDYSSDLPCLRIVFSLHDGQFANNLLVLWMCPDDSPQLSAALSGIHSSTRHRDNVTAGVHLRSLTTGMCVHHTQTELLLLPGTGLCVPPTIEHLEKVAGPQEESQANNLFLLLMVMGWICSTGQPLPPVFCFVSVQS